MTKFKYWTWIPGKTRVAESYGVKKLCVAGLVWKHTIDLISCTQKFAVTLFCQLSN